MSSTRWARSCTRRAMWKRPAPSSVAEPWNRCMLMPGAGCLGDRGHHARAVLGGEGDLRVVSSVPCLPQATFTRRSGCRVPRVELGAVRLVDGRAAGAGDVAHHLVPPDGLAAGRQGIEDARGVAHHHGIHEVGGVLRGLGALGFGNQRLDELVHRDAAEAQGRVGRLPVGELQLPSRASSLAWDFGIIQADAHGAGLPLEALPALGDGVGALLLADEGLDAGSWRRRTSRSRASRGWACGRRG